VQNRQSSGRCADSLTEGSHRRTTKRQKIMGGFKSAGQTQRFHFARYRINPIFRSRCDRHSLNSYSDARSDAFDLCNDYAAEMSAWQKAYVFSHPAKITWQCPARAETVSEGGQRRGGNVCDPRADGPQYLPALPGVSMVKNRSDPELRRELPALPPQLRWRRDVLIPGVLRPREPRCGGRGWQVSRSGLG